MRGILAVALVVLTSLSVPPCTARAQSTWRAGGLTEADFRAFAKSLPELPGRISALRLLQASAGGPLSIALLTWGRRSGWQLSVFEPARSGGFRRQWNSGKLDVSFKVSGPSDLKVFTFGDGSQGVQYSGCAAHSCPNGVFSFLLYVPSRRTVFFAKSVLGKVTYSRGLELPENHRYRDALEQLVKERVNQ